MTMFLILMMLLFSSIFIMSIPSKFLSNNPLFFTLNLFFYIIFLTLFMSINFNSFWFSFTLFLIMIGGMMILFLYFTSISPNEFFSISKFKIFIILIKLFYIIYLTLLFLFYFDFFTLIFSLNFYEITFLSMFFNFNYLINLNSFNLNPIFIKPIYKISLFIIMFLLFSLITITKLCLNKNKPLRKFKN
uniref:NADH dehydrogenase subunit 6 n=1 Tax=Pristaulacus sp. ZJUH_2016030 TaxID=2491655 RepID=A0A3S5HLQ5_9HYME|nr:NADH dehydrogenase subunit 6 [Pristaulacus sp. ZJUH_2016030]